MGLISRVSSRTYRGLNHFMVDKAEQVIIVLHWFLNFNTEHKNSFHHKLLELSEDETDYLSQLLKGLDLNHHFDKSVFECQLNLFQDWYKKWDRLTKDYFISELANLDSRVNKLIKN